MRDVLLMAFLAGVVPFALLRPWIGVLAWFVVSITAPHHQGWTTQHQPVGELLAVSTGIGFLFFRQQTRPIRWSLPVVLMAMLWGWILLTSLTGIYPDAAWEKFTELSKMFLFVFMALTLFQCLRRLRVLFGVLVGALGLFAVKGALFSLLNGGQHIVYGPEGTIFYDNNDFALALVMILPLAVFLARFQEQKAARWVWAAITGGIVLSILFTYSRGGLVALGVLLGVTVLRSKQRAPAMVLVVVVVIIALAFAPASWTERMGSITEYETDASVSGRFNAWQFSWNLGLVRPILGGGFGVFTPEMYAQYAPNPDSVLVAHSIYFQLIATQGFPGLFLYLTLVAALLWRAERLRRRAFGQGALWFGGAAEAIQLGTVGFLVAGAFLSRAWNEIFFYFIVIQVCLDVLAEPVLEDAEESTPTWRGEERPCAA